MISEDYVSFEIAKLLKEKGFNEICEMFYCKPHEGYLKNCKRDEWWNSDLRKDMTCTCPTLQMAMKWLRNQHNLHIMVDCIGSKNYMPTIQFICNSKDIEVGSDENKIGGSGFDSFEEACEAAIKYCLENLI